MMKCAVTLLAACVLWGCGDSGSQEPTEGARKSELTGYTLVRDVRAGEVLEMAMLKPAAIATKTVQDEVLRELLLTSADIGGFLGKPLKKGAKKGDFLQKEMFE